MKAWMRWVANLATSRLGRRPSSAARTRRDRSRTVHLLESLERREVLSLDAPFAGVPGEITVPAQTAHITFPLTVGEVKTDGAKSFFVTLKANPAPGSLVNPRITRVSGPNGLQLSVNNSQTGPFITKVAVPEGVPSAYAVDVTGVDDKVGAFVVGAFLPGDANNDRTVNDLDLDILRAAYGTVTGQAKFNTAADFNDDGRVGCLDRQLLKVNMGVTVVPPAPAPLPIVKAPDPTPVVVTPTVVTPVTTTTTPITTVVTPTVTTTPLTLTPVVSTPQTVVTPVTTTTPVLTTAPLVVTTPQTNPVVVNPGQGSPVVQTPIYYYGSQPAVQNVGPTQPIVQTPVYYYGNQPAASGTVQGQPVVQTPIYYYGGGQQVASNVVQGQPVVQTPVYYYGGGQQVASGPVYVYGQPVVQGPATK